MVIFYTNDWNGNNLGAGGLRRLRVIVAVIFVAAGMQHDTPVRADNSIAAGIGAFGVGTGVRYFSKKIVRPFVIESITPVARVLTETIGSQSRQLQKVINATRLEELAERSIQIVAGALGDAGTRCAIESLLKSAYLIVGVDGGGHPGAAFLTKAFGLGQAATGIAIDLNRDIPAIMPQSDADDSIVRSFAVGLIGGSAVVGDRHRFLCRPFQRLCGAFL